MNESLVVWRFCDGKPGHERQTAGLVAALGRRRALTVFDIDVATGAPLRGWRRFWSAPPNALPPALLLGAGRACQWPLLAARRRFGGRSVYCMKPGLPSAWFDLCFVPQHDNARLGSHVEPTFGVLNDIQARGLPRDGSTLIMIGGPSRHHRWDDAQVLLQVNAILARRTGMVLLTDSRRTPANMRIALASLAGHGVRYQPGAGAAPGGLVDALAVAAQAWVSADSVSMIFEALTAGVGVGLIAVPSRRRDRITHLTESLVTHGRATSFAGWQRGDPLIPPDPPLDEAGRCADLLLARWSL